MFITKVIKIIKIIKKCIPGVNWNRTISFDEKWTFYNFFLFSICSLFTEVSLYDCKSLDLLLTFSFTLTLFQCFFSSRSSIMRFFLISKNVEPLFVLIEPNKRTITFFLPTIFSIYSVLKLGLVYSENQILLVCLMAQI